MAAFSAALWTGPIRRHADGGLGRRAIAAVATGALIAVVGLTALTLGGGDDDDSSLAQRVVLPPYTPSAPIELLPEPSASSPAAGSLTRTPTRARPVEATTTRPATRPPATTRPPAATTTAPPAAQLVIGRTVGLAPADTPRFRLRHRNFVAQIDDINAGSSPGARQDARFTVRRGLASAGCFSLEAVNHPGFFLRHRDFVLRLDRRDNSQLYQKDATFCTHPVRSGRALIFEAVNYPGYFLQVRRGGVRLERVAAAQATAYLVREPL